MGRKRDFGAHCGGALGWRVKKDTWNGRNPVRMVCGLSNWLIILRPGLTIWSSDHDTILCSSQWCVVAVPCHVSLAKNVQWLFSEPKRLKVCYLLNWKTIAFVSTKYTRFIVTGDFRLYWRKFNWICEVSISRVAMALFYTNSHTYTHTFENVFFFSKNRTEDNKSTIFVRRFSSAYHTTIHTLFYHLDDHQNWHTQHSRTQFYRQAIHLRSSRPFNHFPWLSGWCWWSFARDYYCAWIGANFN